MAASLSAYLIKLYWAVLKRLQGIQAGGASLSSFLYEIMLKQAIVFESEFNSELFRRELRFLSSSLYFR